jgi:hypothetical protein
VSFFSSLKTERTARKLYRTRDEAKADVFGYVERLYNQKRRHSTIGYLSPRVRAEGRISLSVCQRNRVQARLAEMKLDLYDLTALIWLVVEVPNEYSRAI